VRTRLIYKKIQAEERYGAGGFTLAFSTRARTVLTSLNRYAGNATYEPIGGPQGHQGKQSRLLI
jgi:hypothetical protein